MPNESSREAAHARGLYPPPLNAGRSRNMQANRRTDTKPEQLLRSALHAAGHRFRKDMRLDLPDRRVRPDIVFTRKKVAVFVDGCFWHGCPVHGRAPKVNDWYWKPKLARTRERDQLASAALLASGWSVVRIWEHVLIEVATAEIEHVFDSIEEGPTVREVI